VQPLRDLRICLRDFSRERCGTERLPAQLAALGAWRRAQSARLRDVQSDARRIGRLPRLRNPDVAGEAVDTDTLIGKLKAEQREALHLRYLRCELRIKEMAELAGVGGKRLARGGVPIPFVPCTLPPNGRAALSSSFVK
jgi:hypothetical protein